MKLLYAEDERAMAEAVADILDYHKFQVDVVYDGVDALAYARSGGYDGIILDIMMPGMDGLEVLRQLRAAGDQTPILLLTAKTQVEDRIRGLDLGADDYLAKPFDMGELLARIRAMLRRRQTFTPDLLCCGELQLDRQRSELRCGGKSVQLPKQEFQMMELLMLNQGRYLSTEDILIKLWGYDTEAEIGIVWVYVSYLRKRLQQLGAPVKISAKRGTGYMLVTEDLL